MIDHLDEIMTYTLCATLIIATVGIIALQFTGHNVAKEVSLGVCAQWGAMALMLRERRK